MTKEENLALARRGLDEVWSGGDLSVVDEIYASSYVFRDANQPEVKGIEELKQTDAMYRTAFEESAFRRQGAIRRRRQGDDSLGGNQQACG